MKNPIKEGASKREVGGDKLRMQPFCFTRRPDGQR